MGDSDTTWWQSDDRRWRKGTPPSGWRQAGDGRWHPPPSQAATEKLPPVRVGGPGIGVPGPRPRRASRPLPPPDDSEEGPEWLRIAVVALAAVLALSVLGVIVATTGGGGSSDDRGQAVGGDQSGGGDVGAATSSTSTAGGSAAPDGSTTTSTSTTTTTSVPAPTSTTTVATTTTIDPRCEDPGRRHRPPCCRRLDRPCA